MWRLASAFSIMWCALVLLVVDAAASAAAAAAVGVARWMNMVSACSWLREIWY